MASVEMTGQPERTPVDGRLAATGIAGPRRTRRPQILIMILFVLAGAAAVALALEPRVAGYAGLALLSGICLLGLLELARAPEARSPLAVRRQAARSILQAALDNTSDAVALTALSGELVYANAAYRTLATHAATPWGTEAASAEPRAPAHVYAADAALSTALYRLERAAETEGHGIAKAWLPTVGSVALPYEITAERVAAEGALPGIKARELTLWRLRRSADGLGPEDALRSAIDVISQPLAAAGLAAVEVAGDGVVVSAHGAIETVTGIKPAMLLDLTAPLGEIFLADAEGDYSAPVRAGRYAARVAFGPGAGRLVWIYGPRDPWAPAEDVAALFFVSGRRAIPMGALRAQGAGRDLPIAPDRMFEEAPVGVALMNRVGHVLEANRSFRIFLGEESFRGAHEPVDLLSRLETADGQDLRKRLQGEGYGPDRDPFDIHLNGPKARMAQAFLSRADNDSGAGGEAYWYLYVLDTTEQKNLELQFAQSQKMQAVGQLAGGIAHDFNNILTAIIGFCDLLLTRHVPGDPSFPDIDQIRQNGTRAASLVRQLLAFSRQQTLRPKVLWLPDAMAEMKPLLTRLMGDKVHLEIKHDRELGLVKVDETQLDQVIVNLAVNARDAMPEGGTLTIRTSNVSREDSRALGHELMPPADYVLIEVQDTGCGIPKEHLGKIFEPFFTTKEVGQGTGLGLSTVYGIVKQTNGFIFPDSPVFPDREAGRGTVFRIYLPRHVEDVTAAPEAPEAQPTADHTGRGTILLVEDEEAVRAFASRALESRGYTVLQAPNGEVALDILDERGTSVDLLISDVVMPGINGPTLVKTLRAKRPETRIILISGYAEDAFRREMGGDSTSETVAFLPKPFSLKTLISKVKEVMAASP